MESETPPSPGKRLPYFLDPPDPLVPEHREARNLRHLSELRRLSEDLQPNDHREGKKKRCMTSSFDDEAFQSKLARVLLVRLLDSASSSVQALALKCLGGLGCRMRPTVVSECFERLGSVLVLCDDGEPRPDEQKIDMAENGLVVLIRQLSAAAVHPVEKKCLPLFLRALERRKEDATLTGRLSVLAVMRVLLERFGEVLTVASHGRLLKVLMAQLRDEHRAIRYRSTQSLVILSKVISDELFGKLITDATFHTSRCMGEGSSRIRIKNVHTFLRLISQLVMTSGHRLARPDNLLDIVFQVAEFVSDDEDDEDDEGDGDQIRVFVMQVMEAIVLKVDKSYMMPFVELIAILCIEYLEYDPMYSYESSSDSEDDDSCDDAVDGDADDSDEDSGSSDESVRAAAAQCLLALLRTMPEQLDLMLGYLCSRDEHPLLSRFQERRESVKLEIFKIFQELLTQTIKMERKHVHYLRETSSLVIKKLLKQLKRFRAHASRRVGEIHRPARSCTKGILDTEEAEEPATAQFLSELLQSHDPKDFLPVYDDLAPSVYKRMESVDRISPEAAEAVMSVYSSLAPVAGATGDAEKLRIYEAAKSAWEKEFEDRGAFLASLVKIGSVAVFSKEIRLSGRVVSVPRWCI